MKLRSLLFALLAYTTTSNAMFCPKNLNLIDLGNTTQEVELKCGKPDSQKSSDASDNTPQEWNYYLKINPTDQGTIKVTFAFVDNKIINMSSNGIGVGATSICGGTTLELKSTMDEVKAACGEPAFISQPNQEKQGSAPKTKLEEWSYSSSPPVTLLFTDGRLTGRR